MLGKRQVIQYSKWKKVKSLSRVWPFATPWTVTYQVPLSMGFSRQEYWGGLPFPSLFYIVKIVNNYSKILSIICIIAYYPLPVTMFWFNLKDLVVFFLTCFIFLFLPQGLNVMLLVVRNFSLLLSHPHSSRVVISSETLSWRPLSFLPPHLNYCYTFHISLYQMINCDLLKINIIFILYP